MTKEAKVLEQPGLLFMNEAKSRTMRTFLLNAIPSITLTEIELNTKRLSVRVFLTKCNGVKNVSRTGLKFLRG
ncbi:hypothetical protein [Mesonia maritima]|uniref:Uncharacterized protein n=1 Tax=Mesonia maritima TaxID=1793873 RepID=A0ABU1KB56_9FLAO|nr:hypothetical protein [Mesonia maritima]